MKTLLIVEDEKMIRQGIHVMVKRCKVEIGEVLECRNGEEALELLKSRKIDVMLTDIRMPRMTGIELVRETKTLKKPPKIVVISGYDDFNYAVEMLKHGVEDYILKPIKREKIEEILEKLEKQLQKEENDRRAEAYIFGKQLLLYLKADPIVEEKQMVYKFEQYIGEKQYCIAIYGDTDGAFRGEDFLRLEEDGQIIQVLDTEGETAIKHSSFCAGISNFHSSFSECRKAYQEAVTARVHAWIHNFPYYQWEEAWQDQGQEIDKEFASQFTLKLSTENWRDSVRQYQNQFFDAEHGQLQEAELISQAIKIREMLENAYGKLIYDTEGVTTLLKNPLSWKNAEEYMQVFLDLIQTIRSCLNEKYDNNRNQNKIRAAVQYIQENFKKDLNMAMVSNHVSMNYSLFSIIFKEYTGVNFVTYLKKMRIEEAKRMLRETDEKVRDIGKAAGFENDKNFLKSFKAACGVSPTEYRRMAEWKESIEKGSNEEKKG